MVSAQHQRWINSGLTWRLGAPWERLRDLLRSKGYTVYDIGNDEHMDHLPPEDHTPYSETNWPGSQQYGVVMALDIMPNSRLQSLQWLGAKFKADRNSGKFPFLKYMNWGPNDDSHAIHSSWQPDYAERSSTDTGHIHLSFRTDFVDWNGSYDPWGENMTQDHDWLNNAEKYGWHLMAMQDAPDILVNGATGFVKNELAATLKRIEAAVNRPVLTDAQIAAFAQQFAQEASAEVIETALRNVLKKGVDNAG